MDPLKNFMRVISSAPVRDGLSAPIQYTKQYKEDLDKELNEMMKL